MARREWVILRGEGEKSPSFIIPAILCDIKKNGGKGFLAGLGGRRGLAGLLAGCGWDSWRGWEIPLGLVEKPVENSEKNLKKGIDK